MKGEKGERRRKELLKVAYHMFIEKGYDNSSIDDIVKKAGIAKGTYYYYFKSKEQMLEEVIRMMLEEENERAEAIMASDRSLSEKIVGIIAAFRPQDIETPIDDVLSRQENLLMQEKIFSELISRMVPHLTELVSQGVNEGIFNCDNIPERVRMLIIISRGLFSDGKFTEADAEVFIDTVERTLYAKKGSMGFIRQLIV